jgi:hypothetical protein
MPEETDEVVSSLSRELVSGLAPEELPLYPSLLTQFQRAKDGKDGKGGKRGKRGKKSSDDQLLGFGGAEAITMLTPVILAFTNGFWQALVAEAAKGSAHGVLEYVKAHLPGHHEAAPPLTGDQLKLVRTVAEHEALRLNLPEGQAGLLADAMMGALTAPPA